MTRSRCVPVLALLSLAASAAPPGQEPAVEAVLRRAGAYVTEFQRQLSGVVAEESYVQDVRDSRTAAGHRVLKSDLLLVKPQGADRWIQFRDVFDVDGKPVRDRDERLVKLFLD